LALQDYGHTSEKPTWLYSNYDILDDMDLFTVPINPEHGN